MKRFSRLLPPVAALLIALTAWTGAHAGFGTSVPVTAELATSIARSMFPQTLSVAGGKLFLSEPEVIYVDLKRVAVRVHVQAYDHRPEEGVALSEEGTALVSGEVGYDMGAGQVLLFQPVLDELSFARDTPFSRQISDAVNLAWKAQVTNPVRADLPPHPYIQPFRHGIQDISYGREGIVIQVWYE